MLTGQAAVRETKAEMWDVVSPAFLELLQEDEPDLPRVQPFDATIEVCEATVHILKFLLVFLPSAHPL